MDTEFTKEQIATLQKWDFFLRNMSDFVRLDKVDGIRFEVRTDENCGHHRPHLHVTSSSASMSIAIDDGEILAKSGKISPVQMKKAQEWIKDNNGFIIEKWNAFSNGVKIPVA